MYINCSNCNTVFSLSANQIPPEGKKVKCCKCGHIWYQGQIEENHEAQFAEDREVREAQSTSEENNGVQIDKVKILAELRNSAATFTKKPRESDSPAGGTPAGNNKTYPKLNQAPIFGTDPTNFKEVNSEILITQGQNTPSTLSYSEIRSPGPRLKDSVNLPILLKSESPSWFNFLSVIMIILIVILSVVLFLVSNEKITPRNETAYINLEEVDMAFNPSQENIIVYYNLHNNLDQKIDSPLIMVTLLDEKNNVIDYQINKLQFDVIEGKQLFALKTIFSGQNKAANSAQIIVGTHVDFLIHGYLIQSNSIFKSLREFYDKLYKNITNPQK